MYYRIICIVVVLFAALDFGLVAQNNTGTLVKADSVALKLVSPNPSEGEAIRAVVLNPLSEWIWKGSKWSKISSLNTELPFQNCVNRLGILTIRPPAYGESSRVYVMPNGISQDTVPFAIKGFMDNFYPECGVDTVNLSYRDIGIFGDKIQNIFFINSKSNGLFYAQDSFPKIAISFQDGNTNNTVGAIFDYYDQGEGVYRAVMMTLSLIHI